MLRGLVIDWGGVLTSDIRGSVGRWADRHGVDLKAYGRVIGQWLGPDGELEAMVNPIHALERGEMEVPHFEELLAAELTRHTGAQHDPHQLLKGMFEEFEHAHDMNALVRRARQHGIRTALLEVGMRKPDAEIFHFTLERLQLPASACVFVDDLPHNITAAAELGLVGVRHVGYEDTLTELEALFGIDLA